MTRAIEDRREIHPEIVFRKNNQHANN